MEAKTKSGTLLLLLGPLTLATAYLIFSRWPSRWFTATSDYSAIGVALIIGLAGLKLLPLSVAKKLALAILYIPVTFVLLGYYGLSFVCIAFGDCL